MNVIKITKQFLINKHPDTSCREILETGSKIKKYTPFAIPSPNYEGLGLGRGQ